jgi:hypothetical protein
MGNTTRGTHHIRIAQTKPVPATSPSSLVDVARARSTRLLRHWCRHTSPPLPWPLPTSSSPSTTYRVTAMELVPIPLEQRRWHPTAPIPLEQRCQQLRGPAAATPRSSHRTATTPLATCVPLPPALPAHSSRRTATAPSLTWKLQAPLVSSLLRAHKAGLPPSAYAMGNLLHLTTWALVAIPLPRPVCAAMKDGIEPPVQQIREATDGGRRSTVARSKR